MLPLTSTGTALSAPAGVWRQWASAVALPVATARLFPVNLLGRCHLNGLALRRWATPLRHGCESQSDVVDGWRF